MAKNITLENPLDENLRTVKFDGESSALEVAKDKIRVKNLEVIGTLKNIQSENFAIDDAGNVFIDATKIILRASDITEFLSGCSKTVEIHNDGGVGTASASFRLYSILDVSDYAELAGGANGLITISTTGGGDITLDSSGDISLDADGDQIILKFGGATGLIHITNENSGDGVIQQKVDSKDLVIKQFDGDEVIRFTDGGDVKVTNTIYFAAETTNTCDSSGGSASATIDWNVSQKQKLTITGTSNTINFTDPAGACNLILKIVQGDGSDTITAGNYHANVKWAGGAKPTLSTANGAIDIVSFYFDGTSYHGVGSIGFATV